MTENSNSKFMITDIDKIDKIVRRVLATNVFFVGMGRLNFYNSDTNLTDIMREVGDEVNVSDMDVTYFDYILSVGRKLFEEEAGRKEVI